MCGAAKVKKSHEGGGLNEWEHVGTKNGTNDAQLCSCCAALLEILMP
jgi:hypothetical protein